MAPRGRQLSSLVPHKRASQPARDAERPLKLQGGPATRWQSRPNIDPCAGSPCSDQQSSWHSLGQQIFSSAYCVLGAVLGNRETSRSTTWSSVNRCGCGRVGEEDRGQGGRGLRERGVNDPTSFWKEHFGCLCRLNEWTGETR